VYSLAIVVHELMARLGDRPVKIFATDVHRGSLERAALAAYEEEAIANVSHERLARYFTRVGGAYQVVPELRQNVVFAQHDVIRDAPFTRVDLITCRNLLIYLQPSAQQRVLSFFHFSLRQGGVLLLGPSEGLGTLAHGFEMLDKRWQLYRKHGEIRTPLGGPIRRGSQAPLALAQPIPRHSLAQLLGTYDALLDEAMPPSLLVGENGELVHAFGGASRFLRLRDGRSGLQVLDLVDDELKMVLMGGLKRALLDPTAVVFKGVRIQEQGDRPFKVTVRRVRARTDAPVTCW
jgi:two-component system CheB/CheR fusion protein